VTRASRVGAVLVLPIGLSSVLAYEITLLSNIVAE